MADPTSTRKQSVKELRELHQQSPGGRDTSNNVPPTTPRGTSTPRNPSRFSIQFTQNLLTKQQESAPSSPPLPTPRTEEAQARVSQLKHNLGLLFQALLLPTNSADSRKAQEQHFKAAITNLQSAETLEIINNVLTQATQEITNSTKVASPPPVVDKGVLEKIKKEKELLAPSLFTDSDIPPEVKKSHPVPLVIPNNFTWDGKSNKLVKNNELRGPLYAVPATLDILRKCNDLPLIVIAVAGPARTGKSYILNRLIGVEGGFALGKYMDACTMGIWMWGAPYKTTMADGSQAYVVLIDTEGLGAHDADATDDSKIFVLTVLLCSLFVYNSAGNPKQHDVDSLEYVSNLAKSIQLATGSGNATQVIPAFFWLLRDMVLIPVDKDGNKCTFKEYMLQKVLCVEKKNDTSEKVKKRNTIRETILSFFPSFDALSLPVPSANPDAVSDIENPLFRGDISNRFVNGVNGVVNVIRKTATVKNGFTKGSVVMGPQFVDLLSLYLTALNAGNQVPPLESAWQTTIQNAYAQAVESAYKVYENELSKLSPKFPVSDNVLLDAHKQSFNLACEDFKTKTKMDCDKNKYEAHFSAFEKKCFVYNPSKELIGGFLHVMTMKNFLRSEEVCKSLVTALDNQYLQPIIKYISHNTEMNTITTAIEKIEDDYYDKATGPAVEKVWKEYLDTLDKKKSSLQQSLAQIKGLHELNIAKEMEIKRKEAEAREKQEQLRRQELTQQQMVKDHQAAIIAQQQAAAQQLKQVIDQNRRDRDTQVQRERDQAVASINAEKRNLAILQQQHQNKLNEMQGLVSSLQSQNSSLAQQIANFRPPTPQVVHHRGCFHPSMLVSLLESDNTSLKDNKKKKKQKKGETNKTSQIPISDLEIGAKIRSFSKRKIQEKFAEVFFLNVHKGEFKMVTIVAKSSTKEYSLTLTTDHVLPVFSSSDLSSMAHVKIVAMNCTIGNHLLVYNNDIGCMEKAMIKSMEEWTYEGTVYNPVTLGNHLTVNGILATCYTINYTFEKIDTVPLKTLYKISPTLVKSDLMKKVVEKWESVTEPFFDKITS